MKRRPGDIYLLSKDGESAGLIQHVCDDGTLPGSNVVRVLDARSGQWTGSGVPSIPNEDAKFWAHVFLKAGETLGVWKKVGHQVPPSLPATLLWYSLPAEDLRKTTSSSWEVWKTDERKRRPKSSTELQQSEFGYVIPPDQILLRLSTGSYSLPIPARQL